MAPSVTVIIPTYNRSKFIGEALESLLRQTHRPTEIIVVDDGSTDETSEVLGPYLGDIRYIRQPNAGPSSARNRGLREAKSEWIAFLDSDDLWLPDKLRVQLQFLERNPRVDFVFGTQVNLKDGISERAPEILDHMVHRRLQDESGDIKDFFFVLLKTNPVPTSSVVFRRSRLPDVGFFEQRLWRCEDFDLWLRFAVHAKIGFIDQPLIAKRLQDDNLINDYVKLWAGHLEVLRSLPTKIPEMKLESDRRWRIAVAGTLYRLGSFELSHGRITEAKHWFNQLRSLDLEPLSKDQGLALTKKFILSLNLGAFARTAKRSQ